MKTLLVCMGFLRSGGACWPLALALLVLLPVGLAGVIAFPVCAW